MNTYNWQIQSMQVKPVEEQYTNVVITINYVCTGRDEEANVGANSFGSVSVTLDPESPYTPYDQLTEDQVWGWIWDSGVVKADIEANLDTMIADMKTPKIVTPALPWAKKEEVFSPT